jgi:hypothetical protein
VSGCNERTGTTVVPVNRSLVFDSLADATTKCAQLSDDPVEQTIRCSEERKEL